MQDIIVDAIQRKHLLKFQYHKLERIVEPHVYGVLDGQPQLLVYQIRGRSSSGGLPQWRRMFVNEISSLEIMNESFPGRRPFPSGKHSSFDRTIAIVD